MTGLCEELLRAAQRRLFLQMKKAELSYYRITDGQGFELAREGAIAKWEEDWKELKEKIK